MHYKPTNKLFHLPIKPTIQDADSFSIFCSVSADPCPSLEILLASCCMDWHVVITLVAFVLENAVGLRKNQTKAKTKKTLTARHDMLSELQVFVHGCCCLNFQEVNVSGWLRFTGFVAPRQRTRCESADVR